MTFRSAACSWVAIVGTFAAISFGTVKTPSRSPCNTSPGLSESANFDNPPQVENMRIPVRHCYVAREQLHAQLANAGQFPHCAVSYIANAAQCFQNRGMHVAKKRSHSWRMVYVLQHENARLRHLQHRVPPLTAIVVDTPRHGRFSTAQFRRGRMSHHGGKVFEHAADTRIREAGHFSAVPRKSRSHSRRCRYQSLLAHRDPARATAGQKPCVFPYSFYELGFS